MRTETVRLDKVTQLDGDVRMLNNMSMQILRGEIMGLVCLNAYGLDALVWLLRQNVPIHYGSVYFEEKLVNSYRHSSSLPNRVAVIGNSSSLLDNMTVADNIFVLRRGFKKNLVQRKVIETQSARLLDELGVQLDASAPVSDLSRFEKCVIELVRAIVAGEKLIILRDVHSYLGEANLSRFHDILRHYSARGITFLYICSHHEEAFPLCDRVALMKNGEIKKIIQQQDFNAHLLRRIAALEQESLFDHRDPEARPVPADMVLTFDHVTTTHVTDACCAIREGECLQLIDTVNTAIPDIVMLVSGRGRPLDGQLLLGDELCTAKALKRQVCVIEENPTERMLFSEMSCLENLCFSLDFSVPRMWLNSRIRNGVLREYLPLMGKDIFEQDISRLSVFSLYNLVYYRVHLFRPKVVFCVKPFVSVDLYMRYHLMQLMKELQAKGIAVVILEVGLFERPDIVDRLYTIENGQLFEKDNWA